MNDWNVKFVKIADTQWGKKVVFSSFKKGEWQPMDIGPNVDVSTLVPGQEYKIYTDKGDRGFSYLVKFEKAEAKQWKGGGRAYDPLNFVSNVVGQAIQAGLIKAPADVRAWAGVAWSVSKEPPEENRG